MDSPTAAKLRYLNDAAHLLTFASPSTAAILQSRYDRVVKDCDSTIPDQRRRQICGSCGFSLPSAPIRGSGSQNLDTYKSKGLNGDTGRPKEEYRTMIFQCQKCDAKTVFELPRTKRARSLLKRPRPNQPLNLNPSEPQVSKMQPAKPSTSSGQATSTANASSRKRAKARKQNSLQAMLAKSKADESSNSQGFGLDLMDLMKST